MQMLAAAGMPLLADEQRAPDDDNPRGYLECAAVRSLARSADFLADAPGCGVKVVAPLLRFLPKGYVYRVLFLERNLDDVLASQRVMLARSGAQASQAPGEEAPESALRQAFQASLTEARRLLAEGSHFEALFVDHARLLATPEREAGRIAAFLGEPFASRAAAMAQAVDPVLHRQRSGVRAG